MELGRHKFFWAIRVLILVKYGININGLTPITVLTLFVLISQFAGSNFGHVWMQILIPSVILMFFSFGFSVSPGAAARAFSNTLYSLVKIFDKINAILLCGLATKFVLE